MHAIPLRRAAALLVALGLLAAAAPVAAAPLQPDAGPSLGETLATWLAGLWPGAASDGPTAHLQELGPVADPHGDPAQGAHLTSAGDSDDPTAEPRLGPGLDPNG